MSVPLESAKHALIHEEPFELVEHGAVARVIVHAVDAARHDDGHGRLGLLHDPHLHGRRVGAQHNARLHEEGVVRIARGVIGGRVLSASKL